ncbi:MAG: hypothetical protein D9V47_05030 [Clostridia bacterium]|nr:MAG: hypothetical protein D9V47_05030 [Clostridia bacterium]
MPILMSLILVSYGIAASVLVSVTRGNGNASLGAWFTAAGMFVTIGVMVTGELLKRIKSQNDKL